MRTQIRFPSRAFAPGTVECCDTASGRGTAAADPPGSPRVLVLLAPVFLVATMYAVFQACARVFGYPLGYLLAFTSYVLVWCALVPLLTLGPSGVVGIFSGGKDGFRQLGLWTHVLLWSPLIFPFCFAFVPRIATAGLSILGASFVLGTVIGVAEEVLWRGLYLRVFPDNVWAGAGLSVDRLWGLAPLPVIGAAKSVSWWAAAVPGVFRDPRVLLRARGQDEWVHPVVRRCSCNPRLARSGRLRLCCLVQVTHLRPLIICQTCTQIPTRLGCVSLTNKATLVA